MTLRANKLIYQSCIVLDQHSKKAVCFYKKAYTFQKKRFFFTIASKIKYLGKN